jgi:hypothetical protein
MSQQCPQHAGIADECLLEETAMAFFSPSNGVYRRPRVSTADCIMIDLQSEPRFWQNEPNAGDSSGTANDLACSPAIK